MNSAVEKKDILLVARLYLDGFVTTADDWELAEFTLGSDNCTLIDKAVKEALDFFNLTGGNLTDIETELHLLRNDIASSAGWNEERARLALSMY